MSQLSLLDRINQIARALSRSIQREGPPKVKPSQALQDLNILLAKYQDSSMAKRFAQKRNALSAALSGAVNKVAPQALADVEDDLQVVVFVAMHNPELLAELQTAAEKDGMKELISYLQGLSKALEAKTSGE